ncbi:PIR Superfamily Protein [Plasmodium ovale curtisi]|uniref:PIR Superfamily Protein n=1 Tax=Plasmodium ovale curtisi TaxID=864141 RepID=A0A1A8WBX5_PLAOA|nr:PIR Superfamily Protein [Plasmodium ovale curtisi]
MYLIALTSKSMIRGFEVCKYLNYWIQNDVLIQNGNKHDMLTFYKKVSCINDYFINSDTCGVNIENIDEDVFGKVKRTCYEYSNHNFSNDIEKFKWIYYEHIQPGNTCTGIRNELQSIRTYNVTLELQVPGIVALHPLGFSCVKKIRKKKGAWDNLELEDHQLLHISKRTNKNSDNERYSISYNSTKYYQ